MRAAMQPRTYPRPALGLWVILLTLTEALLLQGALADCDCNIVPLTVQQVCGVDGRMYQNPCIATCAGVGVSSADLSTCSSGGTPFQFTSGGIGPVGAESTATVSSNVVTAYKAQGFSYLGRVKLTNAPLAEGLAPTKGDEPQQDVHGNWLVPALRCTSEGDVYAGSLTIPNESMDLEPMDPFALRLESSADALLDAVGLGSSDSSGSNESGRVAESADGGAQPSTDAAAAGGDLVSPNPAADVTNSQPAPLPPQQQQQEQQQQEQQEMQLQLQHEEPLIAGYPGDTSGVRWINIADFFAPQQDASPSSATDAAQAQADQPTAPVGRRLLSSIHTSSSSASSSSAGSSSGGGSSAGSSSGSSSSSYRRSLQALIGADNRQVCAIKKWPFTAVGQIEVVDENGLFVCSGTLIKPNKVLTAAHCVWNVKRNTWYKNLSFSPGRYNLNGKVVSPFGTVGWKDVTTFDAFKANPATWDIAVVTLKAPVGAAAGTMGLSAGCLRNQVLSIGGYAQDKQPGACRTGTCMQPYLNCNAQVNPHFCDTSSGMSGAPLWDGNKKIRMVHVAGVAGKPQNQGTTITQFVLNTVMRW